MGWGMGTASLKGLGSAASLVFCATRSLAARCRVMYFLVMALSSSVLPARSSGERKLVSFYSKRCEFCSLAMAMMPSMISFWFSISALVLNFMLSAMGARIRLEMTTP